MIRQWICLAVFASTIASAANAAIVVPASYDYSTGPYQYWDDSGHDLLDGILATPITGDPTWVGFGGSGIVNFDFGAPVHLDVVSVHAFDRQGGAGIMLPLHITLYTSDDGITYSPGTDYPAPISRVVDSGEQGTTGWIDLSATLDSRFLKVYLVPQSSWQFVSEFEFGAAAVPEPSSIFMFTIAVMSTIHLRRRPSA
jgi:hypothetical protein